MNSTFRSMLPGAAALLLGACGGQDSTTGNDGASSAQPGAAAPEASAFRAVTPTAVLMRGPITLAALDFWESVSVTIDAEGVHENFPDTDEEWERVWSAGVSMAEFGNLMLAPPHARGEEWDALSREFVEIGLEAARMGEAQDAEAVLAYGETVLNACNGCHERFSPNVPGI